MAIQEIKVPDIGDFDTVEVIEILVKIGDEVAIDDSIITLESDKASMEIPSPVAGKITSIAIKMGDKLTENDLILSIENTEQVIKDVPKGITGIAEIKEIKVDAASQQTIKVPDIGDFDTVEVIEILVSVGDEISVDDSIVTLESDKASMEIPSPVAGKITAITIQMGDKVSQGADILTIETTANIEKITEVTEIETPKQTEVVKAETNKNTETQQNITNGDFHASPSIRKLARELGVDLNSVIGTGQKGRILEIDLKSFVKDIIQNGSKSGSCIPATPTIDFTKFGEIEEVALSRINKISGKHLHACWLNIPHVTQFDEANIDEIEVFRKVQKSKGNKLTPIVFIIKAVIHCLKKHPKFNSSLAGESLILKKYFNIGVAVNTPNGLMVPVIKNADSKSLTQLQSELVALATKARDGKLAPNDMNGSCFTISSLGGIGGTQFTPIVNAPEVAILGVSRSQMKPVWNGIEFEPKMMLPLSLSYDHKVIDGAMGAEFITDLSSVLRDIREVLL